MNVCAWALLKTIRARVGHVCSVTNRGIGYPAGSWYHAWHTHGAFYIALDN